MSDYNGDAISDQEWDAAWDQDFDERQSDELENQDPWYWDDGPDINEEGSK